MPGNIRIPWETLDILSKVSDPDAYKVKAREIIGNHMPVMLLNRVLLAVYIAPEGLGKTGLLVKTPEAVAEDIWQSKVGLVIAKGPAAYVNDQNTYFYEQTVDEGEWVTAAVNNCRQVEINGMPCRMVEDRFIEAKFLDPRAIW